MKSKLFIALVVLLCAYGACCLTALAQGKPNTLTDAEQKQWAQFAQIEKARTDALNQSVSDLLNTQPGTDSITVHARYQSAWLALRLAQTERGAWLSRQQAERDCKGCVVSEDGKSLVSPKATK